MPAKDLLEPLLHSFREFSHAEFCVTSLKGTATYATHKLALLSMRKQMLIQVILFHKIFFTVCTFKSFSPSVS